MNDHEINRIGSLIRKTAELLKLDLSGKTVLTEVGSGFFVVSPVIALIGGASKVYAWTRTSRFGEAKNNVDACIGIIRFLGLPEDRIEFDLGDRPSAHVQSADIITNLGFVRPLDAGLLKAAKKGTVIPLMCEAWEFRAGDLDLNFCRENGIAVAGTWENHPKLKIFNACGALAAKIVFEAGFELFQNNIVIFSPDHFGEVVYTTFKKFGPSQLRLVKNEKDLNTMDLGKMDFVFVCDYTNAFELIGENGVIKGDNLKGKTVIHLSGSIDLEYCNKMRVNLFPKIAGHAKRMTYTLAHLGPKFIIDLHTAGFKVGELIHNHTKHKLAQYL